MLELINPETIANKKWRKKLKDAGVKGGWNYAIDHAWFYEKIDTYIAERPSITPIVLDVGCGNGMLHTFLEEDLHLGIIGIDRIFGHCPFNERDKRMDLCIDFLENKMFNESADIVYWCSSIEHNTIQKIKACITKSFEALKPGGLFLATFAVSPVTHWSEMHDATNLSIKDAEEIFQDKFEGVADFEIIVKEYLKNPFGIMDLYLKRFGHSDIEYIVGAVAKIK